MWQPAPAMLGEQLTIFVSYGDKLQLMYFRSLILILLSVTQIFRNSIKLL
jgi:hypothetical protein